MIASAEAYRRAVDLNPRDYRAWYGLGQTYELLNMPNYALYYFRRATQLRPSDARMWCAMGQCHEHEQLGQIEAAIRCYHRAVDHNDREGIDFPPLPAWTSLLGLIGLYGECSMALRQHAETFGLPLDTEKVALHLVPNSLLIQDKTSFSQYPPGQGDTTMR